MPDGWDVTARLAAGAPAVEHTAAYVSACRQLGYQHPDLTVHAAQIRDWYGQDDGLDLRALDADRAALSAVAAVADDALRRHGDLTVRLAGVWSGGGSASAGEFLRRHGESADAVRVGLHRAVDAVAALRDELWRAVDTKVDAVQDIDDRSVSQRAQWLAAAQTVTTGAGDRAAASELVDQQVKPFVDNDIRSDWVAAMRQAVASVTAAYDAAIAKLDTAPATFDVPGELGPRWAEPAAPAVAPPPAATMPTAAMPAAAMPAAAPSWQPAALGPSPDGAPSAPAASPAPPVEPSPAAPAPSTATQSPMPSLGDLGGGGMPSLGTPGFGQQLADLIGGLVGSSDGVLPDEPEIDQPDDIEDEPDDDLDDEAEESDESEEETEPADAAAESDDEPTDEEPIPPDESAADPEPPPAETPVAPPPPEAPPIPPAVPEALPEEKTPCEIAADELPQVGE